MKKNDVIQPTLIDIFNFFYRQGFPAIIGPGSTSVGLAIVYKWNCLLRPAEFRMSNTELGHLSGVEFNVGRFRQRLCELCKVDGIPLFTYVSNGTRRAGLYKINVNLWSNYNQSLVNLSSNFNHIDNDLRDQRSEKETEKDPPAYPIDGYIPEEQESCHSSEKSGERRPKGSLRGTDKKLIEELREVYVDEYGYGEFAFASDIQRYGYEFMERCMSAFMDEIDKGKNIENPRAYLTAIVKRSWMEGRNG